MRSQVCGRGPQPPCFVGSKETLSVQACTAVDQATCGHQLPAAAKSFHCRHCHLNGTTHHFVCCKEDFHLPRGSRQKSLLAWQQLFVDSGKDFHLLGSSTHTVCLPGSNVLSAEERTFAFWASTGKATFCLLRGGLSPSGSSSHVVCLLGGCLLTLHVTFCSKMQRERGQKSSPVCSTTGQMNHLFTAEMMVQVKTHNKVQEKHLVSGPGRQTGAVANKGLFFAKKSPLDETQAASVE